MFIKKKGKTLRFSFSRFFFKSSLSQGNLIALSLSGVGSGIAKSIGIILLLIFAVMMLTHSDTNHVQRYFASVIRGKLVLSSLTLWLWLQFFFFFFGSLQIFERAGFDLMGLPKIRICCFLKWRVFRATEKKLSKIKKSSLLSHFSF